MNYRITFSLLLFFILQYNFCRNYKFTDSLLKVSENTNNSEKKISTLLELAWEYEYAEEAVQFSESALQLALKTSNKALIADAAYCLGRSSVKKYDSLKISKCLEIIKQYCDVTGTNIAGKYFFLKAIQLHYHHEENETDHGNIVKFYLESAKNFIKENNHLLAATAYIGLTRFYGDDGQVKDLDSIADLAEKEILLTESIKHRARYFHQLGYALDGSHIGSRAYNCFLQSEKYFTEIKDTVSMADVKIAIANKLFYVDKSNVKPCKEKAQIALKLLKSQIKYDAKKVNISCIGAWELIAHANSILKIKQEAYAAYREAIKCSELAYGRPSARLMGNMGISYLEFGDVDSALIIQQNTLNLRIAQNNLIGEMYSYMSISQIYSVQKKHKEALNFIKKAYEMSIKFRMPQYNGQLYSTLKTAYKNVNDFKNAYLFFEKEVNMRDSIYALEDYGSLATLTEKFEMEKKEAGRKNSDLLKSKEQEKEIAQQKLFRNSVIIVLILVSFVALLFFRNLASKKRANLLLEQQKAEIKTQKELAERNAEELATRQKEILDSIHYANRIQKALMATENYLAKTLKRLRGQ